MHYGETLRMLRQMKRLTQEEVAKKIGKTQQYYSKIEKQEHIHYEVLSSLLKALQTGWDEWEFIKKVYKNGKVYN